MSAARDRATARAALIVIGLVLASALALALVWSTRRVLVWILVAAFFAVALTPLVDRLERRLVRRRAVATLLVFTAAFVLLVGLGAVILVPLLDELRRFVEQAPELLREARSGRGRIGGLLDRTGLLGYVRDHSDQVGRYGDQLRRPAVGVLRGVLQTVAAVVTIVVLSFLMVLEGPRIGRATLGLLGDGPARRLRRVGREVSRTVTGYLSGNLLISVICGGLTFLVLFLAGVPFAAVIALVVALADLVPLVGATLGAVLASGAAFLHSPTAGVVVLVFFVLYQQVENHLLQPVIMSRAVRLNPLTVLVSVLLAAELAGLLGALLAIPAAGVGQILLREFGPAGRRVLADPTAPTPDPGPAPDPGPST